MILNNTAIKIDSNMEPAKTLNFGISDVRLVVDILSKLYAYPIRTLVQEYICNGRDAMREANTWGKTPIDITVPNTLSPVFKVRDYGVGISPDRMANIFVNYGSSTKRNTNAQTGGFGIGAKSAFSYTDSFTITSFVDGIKYIYVAHLADEGGVSAISKEPTDEPNGVEISIGVKPKDITEFRNAVQRCVRFWKESINFLGSKDIHQLQPSLTLGNMSVYEDSEFQPRTIYLIDGIEYDLIEPEHRYYSHMRDSERLNSGKYIVALNVNNGHFKIASSRERLDNTDQNKAHQKTMLDNCNALISDIINSKINNQSNTLQVRLEHKTKYSCFNAVDITSLDLGSGYVMQRDHVVCPSAIEFRAKKKTRRSSGFKSEVWRRCQVYFTAMIFNSKDTSNTLARKLNHYLESNQDTVLISAESVAHIPFQDVLFVNRLDADTLPLPPKKTSQSVRKSARDAICWSVNSNGTKSQWSVHTLNTNKAPIVIVDEITTEARELSNHIPVFNVPKCNKNLVLKKGMTLEQGKQYLLSKHKADVVGLTCLPHVWKKVSVLAKFTKSMGSDILRRFLFKNFPALETEHQAMKLEFDNLAKKYPLIMVLDRVGYYDETALKIVIDEINKQSKES